MADVKWIKITTDIFDDEKILLIESMPAADSIITIWFKLLTLAGKQNNSGVFTLNDKIAYTEEMLAVIFRRDVNTVRLALKTFEQFGMVELVNGVITIPNWGKHQTLDSYEKKKARDRLYQANRRSQQINMTEKSSDNRLTYDDSSLDSSLDSSSDVAISDKEGDKEGEEDFKRESVREKKPAPSSPNRYGFHQNVILTDRELEALKTEFPDRWQQTIENLSSYIASRGRRYENHYAELRRWAMQDIQKEATEKTVKVKGNTFKNLDERKTDYNKLVGNYYDGG